mgnify:CR=1 FL=1
MRKSVKIAAGVLAALLAAGAALAVFFLKSSSEEDVAGRIFLYGERHADETFLEEEFALWSNFYHEEGMRHLFIEKPYYTAEFLNLWMDADSDEIFNQLYAEWDGTPAHSELVRSFYKRIKEECPETVFHGTDIGHQYNTIGARYLDYLEENGMEGSEEYALAQEAIEQGVEYYRQRDEVYRENRMAENFIREYEELDGEAVMGIYGLNHTDPDAMNYTGKVPSMASQIEERYGDRLEILDYQPERVDTLAVGGKSYTAEYFGEQDLSGHSTEYRCREFWRLKDAYEDFRDCETTIDRLPVSQYPMRVQTGQVFVIDYTRTDGSVERLYYRADGEEQDGMVLTTNFLPD